MTMWALFMGLLYAACKALLAITVRRALQITARQCNEAIFVGVCEMKIENGEYIFSPSEKNCQLSFFALRNKHVKCLLTPVMLTSAFIRGVTFSKFIGGGSKLILVYLHGNKLRHVYVAAVVIMQNLMKSIPRHYSVICELRRNLRLDKTDRGTLLQPIYASHPFSNPLEWSREFCLMLIHPVSGACAPPSPPQTRKQN